MIVRSGIDKVPPVFCELPPAVPSLPPYHLHPNSRPRSPPPHFARRPSYAPPQSSEMQRRVPLLSAIYASHYRRAWDRMNVLSTVQISFPGFDGIYLRSMGPLSAVRIIPRRR